MRSALAVSKECAYPSACSGVFRNYIARLLRPPADIPGNDNENKHRTWSDHSQEFQSLAPDNVRLPRTTQPTQSLISASRFALTAPPPPPARKRSVCVLRVSDCVPHAFRLHPARSRHPALRGVSRPHPVRPVSHGPRQQQRSTTVRS